jgi:hypothetical protein
LPLVVSVESLTHGIQVRKDQPSKAIKVLRSSK